MRRWRRCAAPTLMSALGELLVVAGPSGCGKTTLISIIAAILEPDSGVCEMLGHDWQHLSQSERAHFRGVTIGFVFQLFNLLPALTAIENVAVPLLINGASRRQAETQAREVLEAVGLGARLSALPAQLSGGQQQRVATPVRWCMTRKWLSVTSQPATSITRTGAA